MFGVNKYVDGRYEPLTESLDEICNERGSTWRLEKPLFGGQIGYCIGKESIDSFKWINGRWMELK